MIRMIAKLQISLRRFIRLAQFVIVKVIHEVLLTRALHHFVESLQIRTNLLVSLD